MNIITGEKFQDICEVGFSKLEHKEFESQNTTIDSFDIDTFDFDDYNNPSLVYINSSLLNRVKPKLVESKLYEKLLKFKNPFDIVFHNSDDSFDDIHLDYFNIPNINRIFSQNINTSHKRLYPLPIGLANRMWKFGDLDYFNSQLNSIQEKTKFIHFNFTVSGGARSEYRPQCYEAAKNKGLKESPSLDFKPYVKDLMKYKYCLSPEGNGIDCHRMWECLYLRVIPICHRNKVTEAFAKLFPIVLLDDWNDLDLEYLEQHYETLSNWKNYYLLDFDLYIKHIKLNG